MLQIQVSLTLAKGTKQQPYKILSKEKMQQEKHTHCFVFSSHAPFFFKRRDYFKSEDSFLAFLLRLPMA